MNYNTIWGQMRLRQPQIWPTWPILFPYTSKAEKLLEIGAGVLPKFPIQGTYFLDTSANAINKLEQRGGKGVILGAEQPFPFADGFFNLVGGFEILEHLEHPEKTLQEIARVLKTGGRFIFSTPIHQKYWSCWDEFSGHIQRFEPKKLTRLLNERGFEIECCYTLQLAPKYEIPFLRHIIHKMGCAVISYSPQTHYCWDIGFYPYFWISKTTARPRYHASLDEVPSDGLSVLTVCRKV